MDIKIPRIRIVRLQHIESVAEGIVKKLLGWSLWFFLPGVWQVYQWIKPYYLLIKPLLEKLQ